MTACLPSVPIIAYGTVTYKEKNKKTATLKENGSVSRPLRNPFRAGKGTIRCQAPIPQSGSISYPCERIQSMSSGSTAAFVDDSA